MERRKDSRSEFEAILHRKSVQQHEQFSMMILAIVFDLSIVLGSGIVASFSSAPLRRTEKTWEHISRVSSQPRRYSARHNDRRWWFIIIKFYIYLRDCINFATPTMPRRQSLQLVLRTFGACRHGALIRRSFVRSRCIYATRLTAASRMFDTSSNATRQRRKKTASHK